MNKFTSVRAGCKICTDRHADDCYGCIVGIHMCTSPCKEYLKEDRDAEKGVVV